MSVDTEKGFLVTIKNWGKFKGRKDVKHQSWFRCSNRLLEDPDFFDFTAEEILVWIQIMAVASQKNSGTICVNFAHFFRVCRLPKKSVISSIKKLIEIQVLSVATVQGRNVDVTETCATRQDKTDITDKTIHNTQSAASADARDFDILELYEMYPRKVGKAIGLRKLKTIIKTREDFEYFKKAILRYIEIIKTKKTEPQFIMHFSTFVGCWTDYLDDNVGDVTLEQAKDPLALLREELQAKGEIA